ncbi:MAG: hypothetical protein PHN38_05365 [Sulfurospirillaceae bacterium]|nr:hypothetical protein [Sulfurospirillaceae bacterium]
MHIIQSNLELNASYMYERTTSEELSITLPSKAPKKLEKQLCCKASSEGFDATDALEPKYKMMAMLLERMSGKKVHLARFRPQDVDGLAHHENAPSQASGSPIFNYKYASSEQSSQYFGVKGDVVLEDGTQASFSLSIKWEQAFYTSTAFSIQDGKVMQDPLVISLDGNQPLSANSFSFNLNNDGGKLSFINGNGGYLCLDENEDSKIENGSELFGPKSGDGFKELASYDEDKNGWIDEKDTIFKSLRIWQVHQDEEQLLSLQEVGVGAISLERIDLGFVLKSDIDTPIAQFKEGSVALGKNGDVYGVYSVDIAV